MTGILSNTCSGAAEILELPGGSYCAVILGLPAPERKVLHGALGAGKLGPVKKAIAIGILVCAALAGGAYLALREPGEPSDLDRAQTAGEEARASSAEIAENLRSIAENLEKAEGLDSKSSEIRELTQAQRESLAALVDLLEDQLESLDTSARSVQRSEETTADIARISRAQAALLERTLQALDELKELARDASASAADLARATRYGAKLAEDSQEAFERP